MTAAFRIVLVETSHAGNIGATARAMKNMGFTDLWLVAPWSFPDAQASARASGAEDVLQNAHVVDSLDEALAGCTYVAGLSARLRSLAWPCSTPREAAADLLSRSAQSRVALVFGREKSGLTNAELQRCQLLLHIPANPDYSSLNLAMAVQVVCYELSTAAGAMLPGQPPVSPAADAASLERFYDHLRDVLLENGFLDPDNPRHLMSRLRRLFNRAVPDENEINILRGILAAVQNPTGRKHRDNETVDGAETVDEREG